MRDYSREIHDALHRPPFDLPETPSRWELEQEYECSEREECDGDCRECVLECWGKDEKEE